MKKLTIEQQNRIINSVLKHDPYRTEYDNPYHRRMVRAMLAEAMTLAVEVVQDDE